MAGDTELHKKINAYLTRTFILSSGVPNDECLHEANVIVDLIKEYVALKPEL